MTVDATDVANADRSLTAAQATAAITAYSTVAQARLDNDNPGLATAVYDHCHALMICHMRAAADPATGLRKVKTDGFEAERETPGTTAFLLEYRKIIEEFQGEEAGEAEDVTRCDASMPDFKLDQGDIPGFYTEDT
jgi:hypothetical protein